MALLLFLWVMGAVTAQQRDYLFGQLVDATQYEAIPFATIRLKDQTLGVISNVDGTFKIPLSFKESGNVLEISCLGYETLLLEVETLKEDQPNIITLKANALELAEAVVTAKLKRLSAQQIVKFAVNGIPQNYPQDPFGLVGYYRDYQIKNKQYNNLNEALIRVRDGGFGLQDNDGNTYQIFQYNSNRDFDMDKWAKMPYDYKNKQKIVPHARLENNSGNELLTLFAHDAVRNFGKESFSYIDYMPIDFVENHGFKLLGQINYNKESVYQISFVFNNSSYTATGDIYIATEDFAIVKLDYLLYRKNDISVDKAIINPLERYSNGFKRTDGMLLYRIQTEYKRGIKNKMFLNFISFYNKMLVQRPAAFASKFAVDLSDGSFKIVLNNPPAHMDKIKLRDFRIKYNNISIPLEEFWYRDDERIFVLCPHFGYQRTSKILKELFEERNDLLVSGLTYTYRNIEDDFGNKLDERKEEYIHQYREFFVQEATLGPVLITENDQMTKNLPLDSEDQPISKNKEGQTYWMNSPLPNLKQ